VIVKRKGGEKKEKRGGGGRRGKGGMVSVLYENHSISLPSRGGKGGGKKSKGLILYTLEKRKKAGFGFFLPGWRGARVLVPRLGEKKREGGGREEMGNPLQSTLKRKKRKRKQEAGKTMWRELSRLVCASVREGGEKKKEFPPLPREKRGKGKGG